MRRPGGRGTSGAPSLVRFPGAAAGSGERRAAAAGRSLRAGVDLEAERENRPREGRGRSGINLGLLALCLSALVRSLTFWTRIRPQFLNLLNGEAAVKTSLLDEVLFIEVVFPEGDRASCFSVNAQTTHALSLD